MNKLLLILIGFIPLLGWAQNKKTQVLVYGNGPDAYAAAVQSALSGVQTLWLTGTVAVGGELTEGSAARKITSNHHLDAGLWADFLKKLIKAPKATDSVFTVAKRHINPRIADNVLNGIIDTVKNLTVRRDVQVLTLKPSGKGWNVTLSNRQRINIAAVVDASLSSELYGQAGGSRLPQGQIPVKNRFSVAGRNDLYHQNRLRTSVATGSLGGKTIVVPLDALIPEGGTNLFVTRNLAGMDSVFTATADDIPLLMAQAQAIGTAAAYCAFFKTTTDKIAVRTLQGELLAYGARLVPFQDVWYEDLHAAHIQSIAAAGVLKGIRHQADGEEQHWFLPDSTVSVAEIEPVIRQLNTRSQIWFMDNRAIEALTLQDLLGLIKYAVNRGNELDAEVERGWEKRFKFTGKYTPGNYITRRQAAVLLDTYLKPFAVRVDWNGNFQY